MNIHGYMEGLQLKPGLKAVLKSIPLTMAKKASVPDVLGWSNMPKSGAAFCSSLVLTPFAEGLSLFAPNDVPANWQGSQGCSPGSSKVTFAAGD